MQCEGGEQGDPLIVSLGIHDALSKVQSTMGDRSISSHSWTTCVRAKLDTLGVQHSGRRGFHEGRDPFACGQNTGVEPRRRLPTRSGGAWARGVENTGSENHEHTVGIRRIRARDVRGTITKRARIVGRHSQRSLPAMRVWQVLLQCAGPRCHHLFRTLLPDQSNAYATRHDEGMREVMASLLHGLPKAARFSCGDVVGRACSQLHAGERSHSLWFLRPRALVVWRVPHLTLLTCVGGLSVARTHIRRSRDSF